MYDEIGFGHVINNVANTRVNKEGGVVHVKRTFVVNYICHIVRMRSLETHLKSGSAEKLAHLIISRSVITSSSQRERQRTRMH